MLGVVGRVCLVACFVALLGGCTSIKHNYTPTVRQLDFPTLNVPTTVYVGEQMLIQGEERQVDTLQVKQLVDGACYNIPAGDYQKVGSDAKNTYFSIHGSNGRVYKAALCDPFKGMHVKNNVEGQVCVVTVFGASVCYKAQYEIGSKNYIVADTKQMSLIYGGKIKDNITFSYNERYASHIPAFTHTVEYDLSQSDVIGYKGARLKILKADNEKITYVVLKSFVDR